MKRVLTFLAVAALLAVSCNKEQGAISGDAARVTYTVAGPGQVATKTMTMGTIGSDYTLFYEVRLWDGTNLGDALTGDGLSGNQTVAADAWPITVQFDLARGKQYKILFWAQSTSAPEELFSATDLTSIGINYAAMAANNEKCDAFSGFDVITPSGATAASVTLRRPFALVNLGTSDAVQFGTASGGVGVGNVSAKLSGDIATAFNVATGVAGTALSGSFTVADAPIDASAAATLTVGTVHYNYLSAVYVLPLGESSNIDVEYAIKDNQTPTSADITSLKVTNVPVKANHRSNIVGKLLTGSTTYSITVDQAFTGDTNKNATPTFASITELNAFFASLISTGPNDPDHGDIYPESVTVTAIPAGDATTITLPNDTLSVAISILAPYAGEGGLTIAYPTASGAKHSKKVFFNMAGLSKLTANLPDTHLEVVSGSNIDLSDVYTSTSTFVIQKGARVGTANIQQGNAVIAGAVKTLNVVAEATADGAQPGSENAVHIFLEKESAVEKIFLASRTDVVVEQPKDHIDVEATEKKVAVYVNAGAANSTATAQKGGVIYVEANVPCTVTADGTSEAASTVIVNDGASGESSTVEIVATNGGAIDLTANDNCNVTSEGTSDTNVPSTVTVKDVDDNVKVVVETADDGIVKTDPGVPEDAVTTVKNCILYTPGVKASKNDNEIEFTRVKSASKEMSFNQAASTAVAGQVIELSESIDLSGQTIYVAGGVAIDFAGHKLTADKVVGVGGKVLFKQSKKYNDVEAAALEVAGGYLSYVGAIENVEIWGGTYAFDPLQFTPAGIALVADGANFELSGFDLSGKWFVPSIPEAVVYHGTQAEMEVNKISFDPNILPIERKEGGDVLINGSNPIGNMHLPVQNGAYAFLSDDDESPLTSVCYQAWIADFIVSISEDTDIAGIVQGSYNTEYPIPSWGIWGAYGGMQFAPALCFDLEADERFPLLGSMGMGWNYYQMRNTVHTFICGAVNVHPDNEGKVVTAELCIAPPKYSSMAKAITANEFIIVGKYQYTMEEPYYDITDFPGLITAGNL